LNNAEGSEAFYTETGTAGRANQTMEPIEPPWQAIKEWIPDDDPGLNWFN
jgi:hypothetical protein